MMRDECHQSLLVDNAPLSSIIPYHLEMMVRVKRGTLSDDDR